MSIALSDTQIAQILTVSRPLQPQERTAFMAALFQDLLNRREEVGDGELGRTLRDLQHRHFKPPTPDEISNYGAPIRRGRGRPAPRQMRDQAEATTRYRSRFDYLKISTGSAADVSSAPVSVRTRRTRPGRAH
jgi:hypothetical protein